MQRSIFHRSLGDSLWKMETFDASDLPYNVSGYRPQTVIEITDGIIVKQVTVPGVADNSPVELTDPRISYSSDTNVISFGVTPNRSVRYISVLVPQESSAPSRNQIENKRDGDGNVALEFVETSDFSAETTDLSVTYQVNSNLSVYLLAEDDVGSYSIMRIGNLSNKAFLANFDAADGTSLEDYSPEIGSIQSIPKGSFEVQNGRLVSGGGNRTQSQFILPSQLYGRLSYTMQFPVTGNRSVQSRFGNYKLDVRQTETLLHVVHEDGRVTPASFRKISQEREPGHDILVEMEILPTGHRLTVDGEVIRSGDDDLSLEDAPFEISLYPQGNFIDDILFESNRYGADIEGSIITGDGTDQPQETFTLGFAAQPSLSISGDSLSFNAGTPDWPADATGRTSTVTFTDDNGVFFEASGIDNPSGQTAAGAGLNTITVTLNADNYEPVTQSASVRRPGEVALAMSSVSTGGEYEAMVDDSETYEIRDTDGNVIGTATNASGAPQYLNDEAPVIEWDGDIARITKLPPISYRESDWEVIDYGRWIVVNEAGEEQMSWGNVESNLYDDNTTHNKSQKAMTRLLPYIKHPKGWDYYRLSDHVGDSLFFRYTPFGRDGTAEPRDSNRITIS